MIFLLYAGASLIVLWGLAHLFPTRSVVAGFEPLSPDNRRIIMMEWIAEGLTLVFIGTLVLVSSAFYGTENPAVRFACRSSAVMLLALAALTLVTGARTRIVPIRFCPVVKTIAAILIATGSLS